MPLKEERIKLELRIKDREKELKKLEGNLMALRRGDVVISSGEILATRTIELERPGQAKKMIDGTNATNKKAQFINQKIRKSLIKRK